MGYQRRVHGDSLSFFGRRNIKMKAVALFSLIAVAFAEPKAEAKPYYYGAYGLGYGGYSGYYGHGLGYSGYYYGKREALPVWCLWLWSWTLWLCWIPLRPPQRLLWQEGGRGQALLLWCLWSWLRTCLWLWLPHLRPQRLLRRLWICPSLLWWLQRLWPWILLGISLLTTSLPDLIKDDRPMLNIFTVLL